MIVLNEWRNNDICKNWLDFLVFYIIKRNMDLHCGEDWHGTVPKGVTENKDFKVQEDCTVQRDN